MKIFNQSLSAAYLFVIKLNRIIAMIRVIEVFIEPTLSLSLSLGKLCVRQAFSLTFFATFYFGLHCRFFAKSDRDKS